MSYVVIYDVIKKSGTVAMISEAALTKEHLKKLEKTWGELSFFKLFRSKEREDLAKDILTETLWTRAMETVSKIYEIRLMRDHDKMELNKIKQKKKNNKENDTEE